ncbi:MAG: hypothetical protein PHC84_02300 [Clostridia bacterium]|nr:hypothetical protein [Clostridia bacterium]
MTKNFYRTKSVVLIALSAALLTGGKMALMGLPNIEIVTLLIILCAYAFGLRIALPATLIFCIVESLLFGLNLWVISYFIHWPTVAISTALLKKLGATKDYMYIILGVLLAAIFGVTTSAVDAVVASNVAKINFFVMFSVIYTGGITYYAAHVISNVVFLTTAFPSLSKLFLRAEKQYFAR